MGTSDLFGDYTLPLTLDQRAKATLDDMGAVMPYDGGDSLSKFVDELIDEGADLKECIRLMLAGESLEAGQMLKNKAARFAYSKAREQECAA